MFHLSSNLTERMPNYQKSISKLKFYVVCAIKDMERSMNYNIFENI